MNILQWIWKYGPLLLNKTYQSLYVFVVCLSNLRFFKQKNTNIIRIERKERIKRLLTSLVRKHSKQ